ncbi:MAG: RNA polymerase sigma factor [Frankia sp.]
MTTRGTGGSYRRSQARRLDVAYAGSYPVLLELARRTIADPLAAHHAVVAALATVWDGGRDVPDRPARDAWLEDLTLRVARRGPAAGRRLTMRPESRPDFGCPPGVRRSASESPGPVAGVHVPPPGALATGASEAGDDLVALRLALAQLHQDDADLVRMTMTEDRDPREVARALGCTERAVEVRLQRARVRLRHDLRRAADKAGAKVRYAPGDHAS